MTDQTALDKVIGSLAKDENIAPLLEAMISCELVVPIAGEGVQDETLFTPLLLNLEGIHYIPVFDTLERFHGWTEIISEELLAEIKPRQLNGALFFSGIKSGAPVHVVLNPHLKQRQFIFPGNITWIKNLMEMKRFEEQGHNVDTLIHLNQFPAQDHPRLIAALRSTLSCYPEIHTACIYVVETLNRRTGQGAKTTMVFVEGMAPDEELALAARSVEEDIKADTSLYENVRDLSFQVVGMNTNEIGKTLKERAQPFYKARTP